MNPSSPLPVKSPGHYPRYAEMLHDEAYFYGTGFTYQLNYVTIGGTCAYSATTLLGDQWSQSFLLEAGDYWFTISAQAANNRGIVTWWLDGIQMVVTDLYRAVTQNEKLFTTLVHVPFGGLHVLKGRVTGKNASASSPFYLSTIGYYTFLEVDVKSSLTGST